MLHIVGGSPRGLSVQERVEGLPARMPQPFREQLATRASAYQ